MRAVTSIPLHCLIFKLFIGVALAQDDYPGKIDCYSWTGAVFSNNTQCPGSHICCQTEDLCDPNRFCQQHNQTIVPACAVYPWSNCANICQYDPGTGFLPRAVECSDGSFCCDNDPQCCVQNRGIVLNGLGAIVSTNGGLTATSSTTVPASSLTTTTSTQPSTTTSSTGAPLTQTAQTSSTVLSTGAKAGIGIGAAVAGIAIGVLAMLLVKARRRHRASERTQPDDPNVGVTDYQSKMAHETVGYLGASRNDIKVEMDGGSRHNINAEMEDTSSRDRHRHRSLYEMEASNKPS